jgi:hypothetical protein
VIGLIVAVLVELPGEWTLVLLAVNAGRTGWALPR